MNSTKKGSIYIRVNDWYKTENVVKMGISKEVISRNSSYITGELIRGECIYVIEVPLKNLKTLDGELKNHFKEYQVYKGGGTEFYDKCIVELIEPYLKQLNVEYKVLSEEELDLINHGKKNVNKKVDNTENVIKEEASKKQEEEQRKKEEEQRKKEEERRKKEEERRKKYEERRKKEEEWCKKEEEWRKEEERKEIENLKNKKDIHELRKQKLQLEIEIMKNKIESSKQINNELCNKKHTITNNNITNNTNIVIVDIDEPPTNLTTEDINKIIYSKYQCLQKLIELMHCGNYPEHKNIILTNIKDNYIYVFEKEKCQFLLSNKKHVLNRLFEYRMDNLKQIYSNYITENTLDNDVKNSIESFIEKMNNNEKEKKNEINNIKILLYNNSEKIKYDILCEC